MASAAAPLRGAPLSANPAPQSRGRDIVSTILANYGGDSGVEFSPIEEEWPNKPAELQPPPNQFDRGALYSPRSGSEFGFGSGEDDMDNGYDPYRHASPLGSRGKRTTEKWQTKMAEQQEEVDQLRQAQEKLTGGGKALPAVPERIDSKFEKDLPLRPSSPLSSRTHTSSPATSEGPASNLKRSLSRSSKPASLKLHKSNGSTAASIRSASSSTPPPPPPPKIQRGITPTNPSTEQAPPPPPKHPSHSRSNSVKSAYSVKRKPIRRAEEASKSLPKAPSPTKSISTRDKVLPARPIEIDEFTAAELAVKHPAVAQEQSLRATKSRRKPKLTASQRIDRLLDQNSQQADQSLLEASTSLHSPPLQSSQPTSSSESEGMKKIFNRVQSKLGRKGDDEITDPGIQPGLDAEEPVDRSFRVVRRDDMPFLRDEDERKEMAAGKSEGSLSSGYLREEMAADRHKDRADSAFRGGESSSVMTGDDGSEGHSMRDRTYSSSTHATITQPSYDKRERVERLGPLNTNADVSLPPFDPLNFDNPLGYSEPSGPNPVFQAGSSLGVGVAGSSEAGPSTSTSANAMDKFTSAVEALKLHQATLNAPPNVARKPVFGPVRPAYGPIAHLVANRTSNQNQVKPYQLECKNDHQRWFGQRPNDVHCVPCQLCLIPDGTVFQCRDCAMVTCPGCKGKVEDVMARKRARK